MTKRFGPSAGGASADDAPTEPTFRTVLRDRAAVVRCSGPIDMSAEQRFADELRVAAAQRRNVVVDLSAVTFIDCAGLRCLTDFRAELADAKGQLCLVTATPVVNRLFELSATGLNRVRSEFEAQLWLDGAIDASDPR
jgi:anti-anti-sigma factor